MSLSATPGSSSATGWPRELHDSVQHRPCIEVRGLLGRVRRFSVSEYEDGLRKARTCGSPQALSFFELRWTTEAPAIHKLSCDWQETRFDEFRISDWETYSAQMDRLLGGSSETASETAVVGPLAKGC